MINKKYSRYIYLYIIYTLFFAFLPVLLGRQFAADTELLQSAIISVLTVINVAFSFLTGLVDTSLNGFSFWANVMPSASFIPIILLVYLSLPLFVPSLVYCAVYSIAAFAGGFIGRYLKKFIDKRRAKEKPVNPYKRPS